MRIATLLLLATALSGADFNGIWLGSFEPRPGITEDIAFQFTQKGSVLTGKLYGDYQSTPIAKGTIAGELISFLLVRQEQSGNEINENRIRFTGRMVNGEIELTREREASTRAGSGAAATLRNNPRHSFRLKRLP
ncbi:hypothetical protein [Bryobacter aggregatus]|uniref:hypothetical protein n=1 Tax=Bryobacter aggregatus TaxID=360054 RepID=UPI0004E20651|nr:hypothetical protein [Bryobacter aggregatus]